MIHQKQFQFILNTRILQISNGSFDRSLPKLIFSLFMRRHAGGFKVVHCKGKKGIFPNDSSHFIVGEDPSMKEDYILTLYSIITNKRYFEFKPLRILTIMAILRLSLISDFSPFSSICSKNYTKQLDSYLCVENAGNAPYFGPYDVRAFYEPASMTYKVTKWKTQFSQTTNFFTVSTSGGLPGDPIFVVIQTLFEDKT
jgi:hypothetical protein